MGVERERCSRSVAVPDSVLLVVNGAPQRRRQSHDAWEHRCGGKEAWPPRKKAGCLSESQLGSLIRRKGQPAVEHSALRSDRLGKFALYLLYLDSYLKYGFPLPSCGFRWRLAKKGDWVDDETRTLSEGSCTPEDINLNDAKAGFSATFCCANRHGFRTHLVTNEMF